MLITQPSVCAPRDHEGKRYLNVDIGSLSGSRQLTVLTFARHTLLITPELYLKRLLRTVHATRSPSLLKRYALDGSGKALDGIII